MNSPTLFNYILIIYNYVHNKKNQPTLNQKRCVIKKKFFFNRKEKYKKSAEVKVYKENFVFFFIQYDKLFYIVGI